MKNHVHALHGRALEESKNPTLVKHLKFIRLKSPQSVTFTFLGHLHTHETFIVDQIIRYFLHIYHKFSIKSYVVAISAR